MARAAGEPTARQRECFDTYARLGDSAAAAHVLAISIGSLKRNVGEYYRRIGANSGVQAAYLTYRRADDEDDAGR